MWKGQLNLDGLTQNVKFLGRKSGEELGVWVSSSIAMVYVSYFEGFGLPVLEAARNKVPVLCSDLKVFREIYGNGCIYFNPNNSASILNKINFFISLKSKDLKKKTNYNYSRVKKFDWKLSGNEYFKMIFKVINSYEKKS